ncbi:MAG: hypothetical protein A4E66_00851 [Syntrophus sp. PtaB.Bin001]|nr:MAG: hypothetical protein A4E66_00851 [Syntrophus sp. PtaB.Bin001]
MRRLNNLQDLRRYMANLINRTEAGEVDPAVAGKLGYLASILHRVIEGGDLEERISRLEKAFTTKGGK